MHCSSQIQNWDTTYSKIEPSAKVCKNTMSVPWEIRLSGSHPHFCWGWLKLCFCLSSYASSEVLSLMCHWAHFPLCFLNPLVTPLLEHLIYCTIIFHGSIPLHQHNVYLMTLCHYWYWVTAAHLGCTGWGKITVQSRLVFTQSKKIPIGTLSRETMGHFNS